MLWTQEFKSGIFQHFQSKPKTLKKIFNSYPIRIRISSFATTKTLFGVYDWIQIQLLLVVMYVIYLPLHLWIWQMFLSIHCIKGILYILSVHAFPKNLTNDHLSTYILYIYIYIQCCEKVFAPFLFVFLFFLHICHT